MGGPRRSAYSCSPWKHGDRKPGQPNENARKDAKPLTSTASRAPREHGQEVLYKPPLSLGIPVTHLISPCLSPPLCPHCMAQQMPQLARKVLSFLVNSNLRNAEWFGALWRISSFFSSSKDSAPQSPPASMALSVVNVAVCCIPTERPREVRRPSRGPFHGQGQSDQSHGPNWVHQVCPDPHV